MIRNDTMSIQLTGSDAELVRLTDELSDRLASGEAFDLDAFASAHPGHEHELRRLFPAIRALVDLSGHEDTQDTLAAPHELSPERALGDFRIIREIGRGGMGVVYEAEQISLNRRVALKVLPFAAMLDRQQLARFKNEARAAATLDHPNIVAIHSVGCERGVHYYAMQLIEGQSLAQVVEQLRQDRLTATPLGVRAGGEERGASGEERNSPPLKGGAGGGICPADTAPVARLSTLHAPDSSLLDPRSSLPAFASLEYIRTIAQLGIQAAKALDHAHQSGILHRDIKPANLLVEYSNFPSPLGGGSGRGSNAATHLKLWITDFGLARLESDAGMTMTGDILGTLRYMSPEQALAKRVVVDHRSDIYSLGVTLYELLTLQPAFTGDDRQELLRQIAFDEPRPLRQINARVPPDLETIVHKAMEKEAFDRYATALELADDLHRFLAHEPIRARPTTLLRRLFKWSRRHSAVLAAVLTTLFLALVVTTFVVALANRSERQQRRLAQAAEQRAQTSLFLAREAVDEMLTKVASTWVADSMATSEMQRQFLERATAIYQQLAQAPPDGERRGEDAATANERIADIQSHLGNATSAVRSLQTAVEMFEELAARRGAGDASSEQLVRCYRKLSAALAAQSQTDEALHVTDQGVVLARRMLQLSTVSPHVKWEVMRELARLLCGRAELLIHSGKLDEAADILELSETQLADRLPSNEGAPVDDLVLRGQPAKLRATILFQQGRFDEAVKAAREGMPMRAMLQLNYSDAKALLELNAELLEIVGEARLAQGKAKEAVKALRDALSLREQRLGGSTPTQLTLDAFMGQPWRYAEPRGAVDYCGTQLRLAAALVLIGRPYEAECMLGESLEAASITSDTFQNNLEFYVLHANAAAAVAERLAERSSPEAPYHFQLATALWNEMRLKFPQAQLCQSGAHGVMRDWDWFRSTHPKHADQPGTRESMNLDHFKTAFWHRLLARGYFQRKAWNAAAGHFEKAAGFRDGHQAYDRLHLAMAYHHQGQPEKRSAEYDRAVAEMQSAATPDAELEELRRTAERLFNEETASESN